MKIFLIVTSVVLTLQVIARESAGVGNGGGTVICPNKTVLLDYYEGQVNSDYTYKKLSNLTSEQLNTLFFKRVALYDEVLANFLRSLKNLYQKKKVELDSATFKIPDDFKNIFYERNCKLAVNIVQKRPTLGFEKIFFINKDLYQNLDVVTKEGLMFHELLYMVAINLEAENSRQVRQALAYLMSDQFEDSNREALHKNFYVKVTAGGFFSRFESYLPVICPRIERYGHKCSDF